MFEPAVLTGSAVFIPQDAVAVFLVELTGACVVHKTWIPSDHLFHCNAPKCRHRHTLRSIVGRIFVVIAVWDSARSGGKERRSRIHIARIACGRRYVSIHVGEVDGRDGDGQYSSHRVVCVAGD